MNSTEFAAKLKRMTDEFFELIRSEGEHVSDTDTQVEIGLEAIEIQASRSGYDAYCLLDHNLNMLEWNIDIHE